MTQPAVEIVYASYNGGSRTSDNQSACAWCVWSQDHVLLHWEATSFLPAQTNNVMEAQGLLRCLQWIRHRFRGGSVLVYGDSELIINLALMKDVCRTPHLRPWIAAIRAHGGGRPPVFLKHIPRGMNGASDALCNWAMDIDNASPQTSSGTEWPCSAQYCVPVNHARDERVAVDSASFTDVDSQSVVAAHAAWLRATWSLVLHDLRRVAHLIIARFVRSTTDRPSHDRVTLPRSPATIATTARFERSEFEYTASRSCTVHGRRRCVPRDVFDQLHAICRQLGVHFPLASAFLSAGPGPMTESGTDVGTLDALVAHPAMGISRTLAVFRGQTMTDPRPNKALRPWLYRQHLATYEELELLCSIAERGVVPTWRPSDRRIGVRPVPEKYFGADTGSAVVIHKLLADYYRGRCIIATMATLVAEPPARLPPASHSVNDQTDSSASPDATWDPFVTIAQRVCDLRRTYPGYAIYALGADIADAFHHVPVYEADAPAFGGKLPRTQVGIVSGMAAFGWTASPGYFAVLGKAVRHYQRTGTSLVLGVTEKFLIFQWVDDIVLIEVDIGDRLQRAEKRLRAGVKLVFDSEGWHEGKFTTWSVNFHAVGIDWNIPLATISVPQRKIDKVKATVSETMQKKFVSIKRLDSVVGVLRHVISFIPVTRPFIQRLIAVQLNCAKTAQGRCTNDRVPSEGFAVVEGPGLSKRVCWAAEEPLRTQPSVE